jgi:spore germination protein
LALEKDIDNNILKLEKNFKDCQDYVYRKILFAKTNKYFYVAYFESLTDRFIVDEQIIKSLSQNSLYEDNKDIDLFIELKTKLLTTAGIQQTNDLDFILVMILSGETVLFLDGYDQALIISTRKFPNRGINSCEIESGVYGSKDAFCEVMRFNTALIRRRIRSVNLKIKQIRLGSRTQTDVSIIYMNDIVRPEIMSKLENKIKEIKIDAILDVGYLQEFFDFDQKSIFPRSQLTERPDKTASAILEGRIVILVDNSPFALIVPATLSTFFQSAEDYSERFWIMNFLRLLRYFAASIAVCLPGFFLSVINSKEVFLPTKFLLKIEEERKNVAFSSSFLELTSMLIAFELLSEAGVRLPNPIGGTIGIVGGIIVGQAAAEAGIVTPIVIIIMAITSIASFSIPNANFVSALRILKYLILIPVAFLGLTGFFLAILILLTHLCSLESFGIPYLHPFVSGEINDFRDFEDSLFRVPLFSMKKPIFARKK